MISTEGRGKDERMGKEVSSKGKEERVGNDRALADQSKRATGIMCGSPGREDLFKGDPIRWKT